MINLIKCILFLSFLYISGCAHEISIAPNLDDLRGSTSVMSSDVVAGYYISPLDKELKYTSDGGGGEDLVYQPYKDTEAAFNTVLSRVYKKTYSVPSLGDKVYIESKKISYIYAIKITTTSSSSSAFTWPPTDFSMTLQCTVVDKNGIEVWSNEVTGVGHAEFEEFKTDFPLAAKRASEDAFKKLYRNIIANQKLVTIP
jgi:hypothetical protein